MKLKKRWMRKKDEVQNNTLLIDKNRDKKILNAKERLNTK